MSPDYTGTHVALQRVDKLMRRAALLSDLALDFALSGRERDANVLSAEASRWRREAERIYAVERPMGAR